MQTFAQFRTAVLAAAFPDGYSPRLRTRYSNWLTDYLIELQTAIEALQNSHIERIPFESTVFLCGASGFQAPTRGLIESFHAELTDGHCDAVTADWMDPGLLERFQQSWESCGCASSDGDTYEYGMITYDYSGLPEGVKYSSADIDLGCRQRNRWFTIQDGYVWTFPQINSTETVVLRWKGVRRSWKDLTDMQWVDENGDLPREIQSMAEQYILFKDKRVTDCQNEQSLPLELDYRVALAAYIVQRKNEVQVRHKVRYYPTDCGTSILPSQSSTSSSGNCDDAVTVDGDSVTI